MKRLEEIEKLKFQQDKSQGITYFDKVRSEFDTCKKELQLQEQKYEQNIKVLQKAAGVTTNVQDAIQDKVKVFKSVKQPKDSCRVEQIV